MVLKRIYILILFCIIQYNFSFAQIKAIYADKYDVNYYSSPLEQNTKLYFATDLFQFLELEQLYICGAYIDSFLNSENVEFSQNFEFINQNAFMIDLSQFDIQSCRKLSNKWNEVYKIEFQKMLFDLINEVNFDSIPNNTKKLIYQKIISAEKNRLYNQGNTVNVVNLSFLIPERLSANNFKVVFTHYNTKRYTSRDTELIATELIFNNNLPIGDIKFSYPSVGRNTFLKNCLAMTMLEKVHKEDLKFNLEYGINQVIASFVVNNRLEEIDSLNFHFEKKNITENEFKELKTQAINKIKALSKVNLFYYSYYDIEKLNMLSNNFTIKEYNEQIDILNAKRNFILEINENSDIKYKGEKLIPTNLSLFKETVLCKVNSLEFLNKADSTYLTQLKVFLFINNNYSLAINGVARGNEFLFVEKEIREALLNKYESFGYTASKRKKLALFRALNIFDKLYDSGIEQTRIKSTGVKGLIPSIDFNLFIND